MMNPCISVIVPVYNVEAYLKECIDSILNQSFNDFELILVDDGSPDKCPLICDEYAKKDKRIVVIHKENGGLSSARNAGLDACKGDYVSFIDADDTVSKYFLETLIEGFGEDIDFVMCKFIISNNPLELQINKNFLKPNVFNEIEFWNKHFGSGMKPSCCNKLFRSKLFENLRFKKGVTSEDEFIMHRITSKCKRISFIDYALYFYRERNGSIVHSRSINEVNRILFDIYFDRANFYSKENLNFELFSMWYKKLYFLFIKLIRNNPSFLTKDRFRSLKDLYIFKKHQNCKIAKREKIFFLSPKLFLFWKLDR